MALTAAAHHSAGKVAAGGTYSGPRAQTTVSAGLPGVLQEPEPPLVCERAVCPRSLGVPLPSLPQLSGSDALDASALSFLVAKALEAQEEEKQRKEKEKENEVEVLKLQKVVAPHVPPSSSVVSSFSAMVVAPRVPPSSSAVSSSSAAASYPKLARTDQMRSFDEFLKEWGKKRKKKKIRRKKRRRIMPTAPCIWQSPGRRSFRSRLL